MEHLRESVVVCAYRHKATGPMSNIVVVCSLAGWLVAFVRGRERGPFVRIARFGTAQRSEKWHTMRKSIFRGRRPLCFFEVATVPSSRFLRRPPVPARGPFPCDRVTGPQRGIAHVLREASDGSGATRNRPFSRVRVSFSSSSRGPRAFLAVFLLLARAFCRLSSATLVGFLVLLRPGEQNAGGNLLYVNKRAFAVPGPRVTREIRTDGAELRDSKTTTTTTMESA